MLYVIFEPGKSLTLFPLPPSLLRCRHRHPHQRHLLRRRLQQLQALHRHQHSLSVTKILRQHHKISQHSVYRVAATSETHLNDELNS